jgi:hypothetical protein
MHNEQHYRPSELAKLWAVSADKIREWFRDVPGVLVEKHSEQLHKRDYCSLRIPASVAKIVYEKHTSL